MLLRWWGVEKWTGNSKVKVWPRVARLGKKTVEHLLGNVPSKCVRILPV